MAVNIPVTVLKTTTFWPAALVSFALFMVVVALVPPFLSLTLVLIATAVLAALATGRLEEPAVELLTDSRVAGAGERQVMGPVVDGLARVGIVDLELMVRRRQRASTSAVTVLGRRSVVLTPGLVEAVYRGWVATEEVVGLVAQAVVARRARRPRAELAGLVATSPWRVLGMLSRGAGAAFAWLPFTGIAWSLRGVVAAICVLQSVAKGRAAAGLLGGAVIALTYMVPAATRALQARTEAIGDQFVVDQRLGGVLARFLTRYGHPTTVERLRHLEQSPPPPAPSPSSSLGATHDADDILAEPNEPWDKFASPRLGYRAGYFTSPWS